MVEIPILETVLSSGFYVVNARGVRVASFDSQDRAFAFITKEEVKRRGPLHVDFVEVVERRQAVRRLRIARAA